MLCHALVTDNLVSAKSSCPKRDAINRNEHAQLF
jgi:hypothetical protein